MPCARRRRSYFRTRTASAGLFGDSVLRALDFTLLCLSTRQSAPSLAHLEHGRLPSHLTFLLWQPIQDVCLRGIGGAERAVVWLSTRDEAMAIIRRVRSLDNAGETGAKIRTETNGDSNGLTSGNTRGKATGPGALHPMYSNQSPRTRASTSRQREARTVTKPGISPSKYPNVRRAKVIFIYVNLEQSDKRRLRGGQRAPQWTRDSFCCPDAPRRHGEQVRERFQGCWEGGSLWGPSNRTSPCRRSRWSVASGPSRA